MQRSPPTSGRSATRPTSIGTGGRHQSECPADIIGMRTDGRVLAIHRLSEGSARRVARLLRSVLGYSQRLTPAADNQHEDGEEIVMRRRELLKAASAGVAALAALAAPRIGRAEKTNK